MTRVIIRAADRMSIATRAIRFSSRVSYLHFALPALCFSLLLLFLLFSIALLAFASFLSFVCAIVGNSRGRKMYVYSSFSLNSSRVFVCFYICVCVKIIFSRWLPYFIRSFIHSRFPSDRQLERWRDASSPLCLFLLQRWSSLRLPSFLVIEADLKARGDAPVLAFVQYVLMFVWWIQKGWQGRWVSLFLFFSLSSSSCCWVILPSSPLSFFLSFFLFFIFSFCFIRLFITICAKGVLQFTVGLQVEAWRECGTI